MDGPVTEPLLRLESLSHAHELALEHKGTYDIRGVGDTESDGGCVSFLIEDRAATHWRELVDPATNEIE